MYNSEALKVDCSNGANVNKLISELCCSIAGQENLLPQKQLIKLKSKSFEILLKKVPLSNKERKNDTEPFRELDAHIFAAKLILKNNALEVQKIKAVEAQVEDIEKENYFNNGPGKDILKFLLLLENNKYEDQPVVKEPTLLIPAPFTLFGSYEDSKCYPKDIRNFIGSPTPCYFKGIQALKNADNPYLPKFNVDDTKNTFSLKHAKDNIISTVEQITPRKMCTFTEMTHRLCGISLPNFSILNPNKDKHINSGKDKFNQTNISNETTKTCKSVTKTDDTYDLISWNWENLGCYGIKKEKLFVSETNILLDLKSLQDERNGKKFIAKIVPVQLFLQDLKSLTVGIQSDIFKHNTLLIFDMEPDYTTENLLPDSVRIYVQPFLECGTCYKRLQAVCRLRNNTQNGFLFKTFCSALDEYLMTFRQIVFSIEDKRLLSFQFRMRKITKQIIYLTNALMSKPNAVKINPPVGAQLLCFFYNEVTRLTDKRSISLFIFFIKRLCHAYFKYLEKWIFGGVLDDNFDELFIHFSNRYMNNTKIFYDKAHYVNKKNVPGFLQKYEDRILQCGKHTMLLRAIKPNHPLFKLKCPALTVHLTHEGIQDLYRDCEKFHKTAMEVCGQPVTMKNVLEDIQQKKRKLQETSVQRVREYIDKWTEEQKTLSQQAADKKQKNFEMLQQQMESDRQRKIEDRLKNIEEDLQIMAEAKKIEDERLVKENIILQKRIDYYNELKEIVKQQDEDMINQKCKNEKVLYEFSKRTNSNPDIKDISSNKEIDTTATKLKRCLSDLERNRINAMSHQLTEHSTQSDPIIPNDIKNEKSQNNNNVPNAVLNDGITNQNLNATLTNIVVPTLKHSVSDVINSNVVPEPEENYLKQNRDKVLGSTILLQYYDVKPEITTSTANMNVNIHKESLLDSVALSEAKQTELTEALGDVNLNTVTDTELTDLQRNRKRMMQNDLFTEYNKEPFAGRNNLNLNLNTDLARNRLKVLQSEFDIIPEIKPAIEILTPMSTTSDTPITESASEVTIPHMEKLDKENGNLPRLKINVDLAKEASLTTEQPSSSADTNMYFTAESALNTAGLMDQEGFKFNVPKKEEICDSSTESSTNIGLVKSNETETNISPEPEYEYAYQHSLELLKSNFTSTSRTPLLQLAKPSERPVKKINVDNLDVITLTEFLQKSVTIPMRVYHKAVNNEIMRFFIVDLKLFGHFKSLRNYFLLMDGEFSLKICHEIISQLEEGMSPKELLCGQTLHTMLHKALFFSFCGNDKNSKNLSFTIPNVPEKFNLFSPNVLQSLTLTYLIHWPLNIILNEESLERYGKIFRFLVKVKRISWLFENCCCILKMAVRKHGRELFKSPQFLRIHGIRYKFLHFVHMIENHITATALQGSWKIFKDELQNCNCIEDIYRTHAAYLKRIMFLCMINRSSTRFMDTIENIFKILIKFYYILKDHDFVRHSDDEYFTHPHFARLVTAEVEFEKQVEFIIYLGDKMVVGGYQKELGEFLQLFNFNNYYKKAEKSITIQSINI
ncbi:uncharacterized protein LOC119666560 [Teleopsis dalmanni]|uniref:uncharacterized protein LOC119666560 n=1 Tax=Teleopsis dalmanni TaxID=139649 RepID=UPI0018CC8A62|nr:uncharacterized protein LOC119666560 [Teleopsis dalmanni]